MNIFLPFFFFFVHPVFIYIVHPNDSCLDRAVVVCGQSELGSLALVYFYFIICQIVKFYEVCQFLDTYFLQSLGPWCSSKLDLHSFMAF